MKSSSSSCRVTILTCSYNRAPYIAATIQSVLNQTMPDWEWFIHDDGSDDGTYEALAALNDPRIHLRRAEHRGYEAMIEMQNQLLAQAKGQWVASLDSDDMLMPDRFARQLSSAVDPGIVLSHADIWLINSTGEFKRILKPHIDPSILKNEPIGAATCAALAELNFPCFATSTMVRREALMKIGGFITGPALWDYSTYLELSLLGRFDYIPAPLACWRRHAGQITMTSERTTNQYRAHLTKAQEFFQKNSQFLSEKGPPSSFISARQYAILSKIEDYEILMRAHSYLDIGAWNQARGLYSGYMKGLTSHQLKPKRRYVFVALVGFLSSILHVQGIRWASWIKNFFLRTPWQPIHRKS